MRNSTQDLSDSAKLINQISAKIYSIWEYVRNRDPESYETTADKPKNFIIRQKLKKRKLSILKIAVVQIMKSNLPKLIYIKY